jgi:hypothetical protein
MKSYSEEKQKILTSLGEHSSVIKRHNLKLLIEKEGEQALEEFLLFLEKSIVSITLDAFFG